MTGSVAGPQLHPQPQGSGLAVAGVGRRLGAWVIDCIVVFLGMGLGMVIVAFVSRTVAYDGDVLSQAQNGSPPHAPLLIVNRVALTAMAGLYAILMSAYYAGCWTAFRGTLGQRLVSLDVVDIQSGHNLPLWRAIVRWLLRDGFIGIALIVVLVLYADAIATVPFSSTSFANSAYGPIVADPRLDSVSGLWGVVASVSAVWLLLLLISAAAQAHKRGIHDRLAGSIVLGNAPAVTSLWPAHPQAQVQAPIQGTQPAVASAPVAPPGQSGQST